MLEIRGAAHSYCDGISRREFLKVGAMGVGGLTLPALFRARAVQAAVAPQAKAVLLLWMGGGPSHYETFDPKPDAPEGYRGPSRAIPTNVPGIQIHEWWPRMAKIADKYAIIRSISHGEPGHQLGDHWMQTGYAPNRADVNDQRAPFFGAVITKVLGSQTPLPSNITIKTYGKYGIGGFNFVYYDKPLGLGAQYAPLRMSGSDETGYVLNDLPLPAGVTQDRLRRRSRLVEMVDGMTRLAEQDLAAAELDTFQSRAYSLVTSSKTREAFDISGEPEKLKERYGKDGWGQSFLLARRLIEREVPVVALSTGNWDTHGNLVVNGVTDIGALERMRDHLCPNMDRCFSALLEDMDDRGLLEETLILWMGDFGRSPKVEGPDIGRDHWGHSMNVVVAGGGTRGGQVVGATTPDGGYPDDRPLKPIDLIATIYQKMGISPHTILHYVQGRPSEIAGEGEVIHELM